MKTCLSVLALLFLAGGALGQDNRQIALKKGDRILFFGDSLTQLGGQDAPKQHVSKGYVKIVQETLDKTHPDLGVKVDWVATGGHTVPQLLARFEKDVLPKKPTIIVIQIGCNDARRLDKDVFRKSLEDLIDRIQLHKIQVVQCTLTSVGEKHDGTNKDDPKLEEFAAIQRDIIKARNLPYNDLRKAFVEHWKKNNPDNKYSGILTYDGNHWNQVGMQFVAEQMLKRFR
ncbi:MAG: G-D-S-L family lipolytic protein [Planctomycetes bacterium]|nr:G-D-S-L family lipolytic protein [Planctomycetota bacterium]